MFTLKTNLILFFAIALILPNYGKAMEICEKSTQNPIAKENQLIYDNLLKEEDELLKATKIFFANTPIPTNSKECIEFKHKRSEQCKKNLNFIKKICIDIVKNDIKKGAPYTIALGLKIGNNNQITMELLPLNDKTKVIHNRLLFALKLNPEDKQALQELQKLNADRVNKSESKSAESFFPKITLALQANPTSGASYDCSNNTIYIHSKSWLSAHCLHKIIHEFIHRLQHAASNELGGVYAGPLDKERYAHLYNLIAIEVEACRKSIENHPDPRLLLEWLAPQVKPFDQNQNDLLFPYYSPACEYVVAYKHCLKNKISIDDKFKAIYEVAHEHYKKRKDREILLNDWIARVLDPKYPSNNPSPTVVDPKNLSNYLTLVKEDFKIRIHFLMALAGEIINPTQQDLKKHVLDTVEKAKEGVFGCKKYFKLKEKFNLLPK